MIAIPLITWAHDSGEGLRWVRVNHTGKEEGKENCFPQNCWKSTGRRGPSDKVFFQISSLQNNEGDQESNNSNNNIKKTPTFGWASISDNFEQVWKFGKYISYFPKWKLQKYKQQHLPLDGRASCRAPTITQKHNNNINNNIYLWMGKHLARHQQ